MKAGRSGQDVVYSKIMYLEKGVVCREDMMTGVHVIRGNNLECVLNFTDDPQFTVLKETVAVSLGKAKNFAALGVVMNSSTPQVGMTVFDIFSSLTRGIWRNG